MTERQQASPPDLDGLQWQPVGKSPRVCIAEATASLLARWGQEAAWCRQLGVIGISAGKVIWCDPEDPPAFVARLVPELRANQ